MPKKKKKKPSMLIRQVEVTEYLSTGSTLLDMALSCNKSKYGGIPTRRIVEFSGTGASGKSYICAEICGDAIRKGYTVFVDDIERRWDLDRLETFGFTKTHKQFKYLPQSSSVEGCFEQMFKILKHRKDGSKTVYIIDPIAALYAEAEKKSDKMGQAKPKALQKYMRFLKDFVVYNDSRIVSIIFSNQLIDNVGVMFGEKQTTPGGNAMKHWPTVRVRFTSPSKVVTKIKGTAKDIKFNRVDGINLRAVVVKNSEDDPYRAVDFSIIFGHGIDNVKDCITWLRDRTSVLGNASSSWYKFPKIKGRKPVKPVQGLPAFIKLIEDNDLEFVLEKILIKFFRKWYENKRKPRRRRTR